MYKLSSEGILRKFTTKNLFVPIRGELAKKGVTVDLNDEAFKMLSYISEEAHSLQEILKHLKTHFSMTENDEDVIQSSIEKMIEANLIFKVKDEKL